MAWLLHYSEVSSVVLLFSCWHIIICRPHTLNSTSTSKSFQSTVTGELNAPYSKQFVHSKSSQYRRMKTEWKSNVYLARSRIQVRNVWLVFVFVLLWFEPRALCVLSKYSTTELIPALCSTTLSVCNMRTVVCNLRTWCWTSSRKQSSGIHTFISC